MMHSYTINACLLRVFHTEVLILVVMDDALVHAVREAAMKVFDVLILVVMDDALVLTKSILAAFLP